MPHTPGPWQLSKTGLSVQSEFLQGIASTGTPNGTIGLPERQANARLIAAAPELLAACEHVLAVIGDEGECNHDTDEEWVRAIHEKLRPIIAKAKGA